MSPAKSTIDAVYSDAEREELGHLDYLIGRLDGLRERALIGPDAYATVNAESQVRRQAIELSGKIRHAINEANRLARKDARGALKWAEIARGLDPSREEPWNLVVTLEWDLGNRDAAIAACALGTERFPRLEAEGNRLRTAQRELAEQERIRAERALRETEINGLLAQARQALEQGRDAEVIALGQQILALRPDHVDALATIGFAQQRSGQIEAALASYHTLARLQPANNTWSQWVRNLQIRGIAHHRTERPVERGPVTEPADDRMDSTHSLAVDAPPPAISWSSFAGEFVKEHSQELLLCLAVLLIVVSSTVGAHMLLGDLLWSPVGKCALAMIATLLFAAFGAGLLRWGAARAGRMMLVATLIVVPIHFMLVGEMKLLHQPSALVVAFLAIEGVALVCMVRWVSGMLAPVVGARFLTASLLLLSLGSAATARGSPVAWELQFASFQGSALVFLAADWALGARRWGETSKQHRDFVYMMLGLLGFALVACLVRTGAYALLLPAPLYGLPVMFVATACVHTARRLVPDEPDRQRLALLRFGGFGLSGLAFALVLASPPFGFPVYFANTLAVSLVGLGLYVASLRIDRHPVFLYLAFGAIVAGRLGAHYFVAGRLHLIEEAIRQLLGYPHHLPTAFRAFMGVPINAGLAVVSLYFARHWHDRRLARHCHYIGLPVSVAACVWSGFEPLAAVICLTAYAILYLAAVWIFAVPWVTYLAAAALAGTVYFGTMLVPGITRADQALAAALLGFVFWGTRVALRRRRVAPAYHVPWVHTALALSGVAMTAASAHLASVGAGSWTGAGAFLVIASLAFLLNRERPRAIWAHLAMLSYVEFTICGLALGLGVQNLAPYHYGLLFMADGLSMLAVAEVVSFFVIRSESQPSLDRTDGVVTSRWVGALLAAIPRSTLVLTAVADGMGVISIESTWLAGLVFLLGSASLLWLTRLIRWPSLVYIGLAQFVAGTLDLTSWAVGWDNNGVLAGWMTVATALLALTLWGLGVAWRRFPRSAFYVEPCFRMSFALTAGALVGAIDTRYLCRDAHPLAAVALGLNVLVTMLLARAWRLAELTYAAVFHVVALTFLVLFSVGNNNPAMAYVLGLAAVIEAIVLWAIGIGCERSRDSWASACARPVYHWSLWMTGAAVLMSDRSALVLALVAVSFLLAIKSLPRVQWLYGAVAALLAACYFRWLGQVSGIVLICGAMLAAVVLSGLGIQIQRHKTTLCSRLGLHSLAYEFPLFHWSIAVAVIALALRVGMSFDHGEVWTSHGWFPLALAALAVIMLRAYPRRVCVHASLVFLTWAVVAAVAPWLTSVCFVGLAGLSLALSYLLFERLARPYEPALCARLGVIDAGYAQVVRGWSLAVFGLMLTLLIAVVADEMSWAMLGHGPIPLALGNVDWWAMLATLTLTGAFLMALGSDVDGWGLLEPAHMVIALLWVAVAMLWWLGVDCSPLGGRVVDSGIYFPLATAAAGLATAQIVRRHTQQESWHELGWLGDLRFESMGRLLSIQACVLAGLAVAFTKGAIEPATAVTLILVSLTAALVTLATGWQGLALAASVTWSTAWGVTGMVVARRLGWIAPELQATCASVGLLAAAYSLLEFSVRQWRGASGLKSEAFSNSYAGLESRSGLCWAMESVAFASSFIAVVIVLAAGANVAVLGGWGTTAGVGVILVAALLLILLVPRWQSEWLVYLAQTVVLLAYVDYRLAFDQPIAFDAIVLTLMGYLDLLIAELLERLEHKIYARPARFFSLLLPGLPLLQLVRQGGLDEVSLFHLLAAGTFYGIACGQLRWKTLGYAAAVLYNAALWVLWSKLGWKLSTHPQFFLVPVGLSTILFAEVNRLELGRSNVNNIRTVGLTIIYLSLAVPIWRFESFGAWIVLLIGSLVGVFVGIGLRLQTFLWMGLTTFVLTVIYEMGRVSLDYAFAKWAIMLAMGIGLVLFVALNEKKRIVDTMRLYFDEARLWE